MEPEGKDFSTLQKIGRGIIQAGLVGSEIGTRMLSSPTSLKELITGTLKNMGKATHKLGMTKEPIKDVASGYEKGVFNRSVFSPSEAEVIGVSNNRAWGSKVADDVQKIAAEELHKADGTVSLKSTEGSSSKFISDQLKNQRDGKTRLGDKEMDLEIPARNEFKEIIGEIDETIDLSTYGEELLKFKGGDKFFTNLKSKKGAQPLIKDIEESRAIFDQMLEQRRIVIRDMEQSAKELGDDLRFKNLELQKENLDRAITTQLERLAETERKVDIGKDLLKEKAALKKFNQEKDLELLNMKEKSFEGFDVPKRDFIGKGLEKESGNLRGIEGEFRPKADIPGKVEPTAEFSALDKEAKLSDLTAKEAKLSLKGEEQVLRELNNEVRDLKKTYSELAKPLSEETGKGSHEQMARILATKDISSMTLKEAAEFEDAINTTIRALKTSDDKNKWSNSLLKADELSQKLSASIRKIADESGITKEGRTYSDLKGEVRDVVRGKEEVADLLDVGDPKKIPSELLSDKIGTKLSSALDDTQKTGEFFGSNTATKKAVQKVDEMFGTDIYERLKKLSVNTTHRNYKKIGDDLGFGSFKRKPIKIRSLSDRGMIMSGITGAIGVVGDILNIASTPTIFAGAGAVEEAAKHFGKADLRVPVLKWFDNTVGPLGTSMALNNPVRYFYGTMDRTLKLLGETKFAEKVKNSQFNKTKLGKRIGLGSKDVKAINNTYVLVKMLPKIKDELMEIDETGQEYKNFIAKLEADPKYKDQIGLIESIKNGIVQTFDDLTDESVEALKGAVSESAKKMNPENQSFIYKAEEEAERVYKDFESNMKDFEGVKKGDFKNVAKNILNDLPQEAKELYAMTTDPEKMKSAKYKEYLLDGLDALDEAGMKFGNKYSALGTQPHTFVAMAAVNDIIKKAGGEATLNSLFRDENTFEHKSGEAFDIRGVNSDNSKALFDGMTMSEGKNGYYEFDDPKMKSKVNDLLKELNKNPLIKKAIFETKMPPSGTKKSWAPHIHVQVDDVGLLSGDTKVTAYVDLMGMKDLFEINMTKDTYGQNTKIDDVKINLDGKKE